jgi:hypothetical protein
MTDMRPKYPQRQCIYVDYTLPAAINSYLVLLIYKSMNISNSKVMFSLTANVQYVRGDWLDGDTALLAQSFGKMIGQYTTDQGKENRQQRQFLLDVTLRRYFRKTKCLQGSRYI